MKTYLIPIIALGLLCSCNNDNNKPEDSTEAAEDANDVKFDKDSHEKDAEFAVKAADGGMFEVAAADLALSKTTNADVKALAEMMKKDHSAANTELKAMAASKNITLPDSMSNDKQDMMEKLREKSGADFDKEYVDMMVDDHDKDIQLFNKESMDGTDKEIRDWAAQKLPTLRHHYDMAKETKDKLK
jgi:putative membrane protein